MTSATENQLPVTVDIFSTAYHLMRPQPEQQGGIFIGGNEEDVPDVLLTCTEHDSEEIDKDHIRYATEGVLSFDEGKITLRYEESEALGMENAVTVLSFSLDVPETVVMMRSGSAAASMIFSTSEPRQYAHYETGVPGMPLDLCIRSRKVKNSIGPLGGVLVLDYLIEIHGAVTERTVMRIRVTPHTAEGAL